MTEAVLLVVPDFDRGQQQEQDKQGNEHEAGNNTQQEAAGYRSRDGAQRHGDEENSVKSLVCSEPQPVEQPDIS